MTVLAAAAAMSENKRATFILIFDFRGCHRDPGDAAHWCDDKKEKKHKS
jgi:hypothetical protein